jgi:tellurite resistance protein
MASSFTDDTLADLTLLALVIAHGADADLDPREVDALATELHRLAPDLSGDDVIGIVRRAVYDYQSTRVEGAETVVHRLAGTLSPDSLDDAYSALEAVADADEALHPMERRLLSQVAAVWGLSRK